MRVFLRFILLILFTFIFAFPASAKASECSAVPRPQIEINLHEVPVKFDVSKSEDYLSSLEMTTSKQFPHSVASKIGGGMSGQLTLDHRMGFKVHEAQSQDGQCLGLSHVIIDITIEPTIFIAQDYQTQSCWFKVIFEHETKHIDVDRAILAKYKDQLSDVLNMLLLEPQDYTILVSADQQSIDMRKTDLQQGLENALEVMFNKMMTDRTAQQQAIDSHHEYATLARACRSAS